MGQNKFRWFQVCQFTKLMFPFYLNKKYPSFFVRDALSCCGCLSSFVRKPGRLPASLQILGIISITCCSIGLINMGRKKKKEKIFFNLFRSYSCIIWKWIFAHTLTQRQYFQLIKSIKFLQLAFSRTSAISLSYEPHPG